MIDWTRVRTLQEDVGRDDFDEIVALFLVEVDAYIDRLRTSPDLKSLGDDLHFLKGSAAGLGFTTFVEKCQTGEALCEQARAQEVDIPAILAAYADSKQVFMQEMPSALEA